VLQSDDYFIHTLSVDHETSIRAQAFGGGESVAKATQHGSQA